MSAFDQLAYEHPAAVSAAVVSVCVLAGVRFGVPLFGATVGFVAGGIIHYAWTRGAAHERYLSQHPPESSEVVRG
jgi:hypothetical protein